MTDKKPNSKGRETGKLFIHIAIIAILVVLGALAAHFGLILFTRHNALCRVPEFQGLIIHEAEYVAAEQDLRIVINDSLYAPMYEGGMVLDQLPKPGVGVKPGRTIYVTINAFGVKMVEVPYVAGRSLRQAKNMLEVAGLQIERLVYEPDMATNYVLAEYHGTTQITDSTTVNAIVGSGITLHVGMSENSRRTVMPMVVGMTLSEAKSRLWESGLNVGVVSMPSNATDENRGQARVYMQEVNRGWLLTLGSDISLGLTLDGGVVSQAITDMEIAEMEAKESDSLFVYGEYIDGEYVTGESLDEGYFDGGYQTDESPRDPNSKLIENPYTQQRAKELQRAREERVRMMEQQQEEQQGGQAIEQQTTDSFFE